jgi:hypothetical protein
MHRLPVTGRWTVLQHVAWEGPGLIASRADDPIAAPPRISRPVTRATTTRLPTRAVSMNGPEAFPKR